ncbi:BTAD domain-containing putative transcriptional regulator [Kitasatospora sp. NPDC001660]
MLEIGILGSLRVCRDGEDVTPSAPKLRQVLVLLVLNANTLVSADQLCEELWEDNPPLSALTTLQTYIYQLRRRLRLATGQNGAPFASCPPHGRPALLTRVGGYELQLEDKQAVDAYRFQQLVERGRAEQRAGLPEQEAGTLAEALRIWQGQALVDVTGSRRLSAWSAQLEERRRGAMERRFAIELELGRHHAVLDELSAAFRAHTTHEAFADQLMRALHRDGRRPEALDVFRTLRARLVDDLGLEPSTALQQLHQEVLADRGQPAAPVKTGTGRPVANPLGHLGPAQLPADIDNFVGREAELDELAAYLGDTRRAETGTRVVEVHGAPGVGKTAFAIRAAHRLRRHFPDGQLYIDLSAVGNGTAQLAEALAAALSACGLRREELPTGLDDLSRLLRSWTADRRVLVVVDDVLAVSQLRAFIPGGSGCAVIATNRYQVNSLGTGRRVVLSALSTDESLRLYNRAAAGRRWQDEPAAVHELLRMCEGLPLVVRAAAARLAARPGWSAARLVERLHRNQSALLGQPADTHSLVSTVESSYRHLSDEHQELLHLLAERNRRCWRADDAATLLSRRAEDAELLLEDLVDVHLVDELPVSAEDRHSGAAPMYTVPRLTRQALLLLRGDDAPAVDPRYEPAKTVLLARPGVPG